MEVTTVEASSGGSPVDESETPSTVSTYGASSYLATDFISE